MEQALIGEYVQRYSTEVWVNQTGFIQKENYYQFNKTIQQQLKEMNEDTVDLLLEAIECQTNAVATE